MTHGPRTRPVLIKIISGQIARHYMNSITFPSQEKSGSQPDDWRSAVYVSQIPPPAPRTTTEGGVGPRVDMIACDGMERVELWTVKS